MLPKAAQMCDATLNMNPFHMFYEYLQNFVCICVLAFYALNVLSFFFRRFFWYVILFGARVHFQVYRITLYITHTLLFVVHI